MGNECLSLLRYLTLVGDREVLFGITSERLGDDFLPVFQSFIGDVA
jgi:hypothetical protein